MKFFIDTANLEEIAQAVDMGMVDGVTTNPSLVARENKPFEALLKDIAALVDGPISAEVISSDSGGMVEEGRKLAALHPNIVVKIPMTTAGLKAVKQLHGHGIKTNVTLIFSASQALMAAKAGADYVSPFVGRLDDISENGMNLVQDVLEIFDNYAYSTEVIVASVRHPMHVVESALMGAHIATIPFKVIAQLASHPLTDIGMEKFLSDWAKRPRK
ncbi:MAG TPA: fructose-6-phosphate aldolase [Desulfurivibrio alkaliphilus]|uniref:Probable transaldolase n=1 Tax=Desulfurivibrio alkaliphilus TaxID=427923 RepID=A0A7C2XZ02_9BACT|nr:fructose-6-phosphate aldolase [Desulfurivibrio alkaliphilus]